MSMLCSAVSCFHTNMTTYLMKHIKKISRFPCLYVNQSTPQEQKVGPRNGPCLLIMLIVVFRVSCWSSMRLCVFRPRMCLVIVISV